MKLLKLILIAPLITSTMVFIHAFIKYRAIERMEREREKNEQRYN